MAKAKVLGPFSGTAWAGRTSEIQHRVPSRRQSLQAATGSLEENTLPLLWCWLSSTVNKVLMLCRYRASTSDFLFHVKWNFRWNWREVVAYQRLAHCFAESFYQSLVSELKIGHRNKTTCSESNPVRKGRLLRFESNSTATSNGGAQKLGNDVRRNSELIAIKVCSAIGRKWI